jgi:hypothetical protein
MKKGRFLCRFLLAFAAALAVWQWAGASHWYARSLLDTARLLGPVLHGWVLEDDPSGQGLPTWVHGARRVQASLQFDALAVGLVPVLALLVATSGLGIRHRLRLLGVGALLCFALDTLIVSLFPVLVFYKNPFTDVLGTFLGVVAFVGAPVIIWFTLTYQQLQQSLRRLR